VIRVYRVRMLMEKRVELTVLGEGKRKRKGMKSSPCMRRRLGRKVRSFVKGEMAIVSRDINRGRDTNSGTVFGGNLAFVDEGELGQVEERNRAR